MQNIQKLARIKTVSLAGVAKTTDPVYAAFNPILYLWLRIFQTVSVAQRNYNGHHPLCIRWQYTEDMIKLSWQGGRQLLLNCSQFLTSFIFKKILSRMTFFRKSCLLFLEQDLIRNNSIILLFNKDSNTTDFHIIALNVTKTQNMQTKITLWLKKIWLIWC